MLNAGGHLYGDVCAAVWATPQAYERKGANFYKNRYLRFWRPTIVRTAEINVGKLGL